MHTMIRRSIVIAESQISVTLENSFWNCLKDIALSQEVTLSELVDDIDMRRLSGSLASAIRQYVLAHYQGYRTDSADIQQALGSGQCGLRH